jgi:RES domain-containing protein
VTPLPAALGGSGAVVAWRLERDKFLTSWPRAEGAFLVGGRWSSPGRRVIYTALDPSTAILEVAVHKGFAALDVLAHSLLQLSITDPAAVHVLPPAGVPEPAWLRPGSVSAAQQRFGDALLDAHPMVALPSVVSRHAWNLLIDAAVVPPYAVQALEPFNLDPRLRPA